MTTLQNTAAPGGRTGALPVTSYFNEIIQRAIPPFKAIAGFGIPMRMEAHSGNDSNGTYIGRFPEGEQLDPNVHPDYGDLEISVFGANTVRLGAAIALPWDTFLKHSAGTGMLNSPLMEGVMVNAALSLENTKEAFEVKVVASTSNVYTCTKNVSTGGPPVSTMNKDDVEECYIQSVTAGMKPVTRAILASTDQATVPISPSYVLFMSVGAALRLAKDARTSGSFVPVIQYSGMGKTVRTIPGELGMIDDQIRLVMTEFLDDTIQVGAQTCRKAVLIGAEAFFKLVAPKNSPMSPKINVLSPHDSAEVIETTYKVGYSFFAGIALHRDKYVRSLVYAVA